MLALVNRQGLVEGSIVADKDDLPEVALRYPHMLVVEIPYGVPVGKNYRYEAGRFLPPNGFNFRFVPSRRTVF